MHCSVFPSLINQSFWSYLNFYKLYFTSQNRDTLKMLMKNYWLSSSKSWSNSKSYVIINKVYKVVTFPLCKRLGTLDSQLQAQGKDTTLWKAMCKVLSQVVTGIASNHWFSILYRISQMRRATYDDDKYHIEMGSFCTSSSHNCGYGYSYLS
jgi:hypothetical protein